MHVMHCKPQGSKIWKKVEFSTYLAFATASICRPNIGILFYDLYPFIILTLFYPSYLQVVCHTFTIKKNTLSYLTEYLVLCKKTELRQK